MLVFFLSYSESLLNVMRTSASFQCKDIFISFSSSPLSLSLLPGLVWSVVFLVAVCICFTWHKMNYSREQQNCHGPVSYRAWECCIYVVCCMLMFEVSARPVCCTRFNKYYILDTIQTADDMSATVYVTNANLIQDFTGIYTLLGCLLYICGVFYNYLHFSSMFSSRL